MAHRKLSQSLSANAAAVFLAAGAGVAIIGSSKSDPTHVDNCKRSSWKNDFLLQSSWPTKIILHNPIRAANHALCEESKSEEQTESQRFQRALAHHRSQISSYRKAWEYSPNSSATTSTKTPSRSWPDDIPSSDELPWLLADVKYCARSPNFRSDKDYCSKLSFRVASALLIQFDEESQERGFEILKSLAEKGYSDAMVYYGMCLNEGRVANQTPNSEAAVSWFKRCSEMYEHPQSQYELGVAFYTGEGLAEDEEEAVRLFRLSAEQDHPAACYMLGDCLLDGVGVETDRALALEWLVRAAELGHRGARSRVMAVLEKKEGEDYGCFTDASRQSLVEHTVLSANKEGHIVRRRTTLRRQIGGGSRNPTELQRRQTIVSKSRKE